MDKHKLDGTQLQIRLTPVDDYRFDVLFTVNNYDQARLRRLPPTEVWYLFFYLDRGLDIQVTHDTYDDIKTRDDVLDLFASPGGAPDGDVDTFEALDALFGENKAGVTKEQAYEALRRESPGDPEEYLKDITVTKVRLPRLRS